MLLENELRPIELWGDGGFPIGDRKAIDSRERQSCRKVWRIGHRCGGEVEPNWLRLAIAEPKAHRRSVARYRKRRSKLVAHVRRAGPLQRRRHALREEESECWVGSRKYEAAAARLDVHDSVVGHGDIDALTPAVRVEPTQEPTPSAGDSHGGIPARGKCCAVKGPGDILEIAVKPDIAHLPLGQRRQGHRVQNRHLRLILIPDRDSPARRVNRDAKGDLAVGRDTLDRQFEIGPIATELAVEA
jgi:hypothetical protein